VLAVKKFNLEGFKLLIFKKGFPEFSQDAVSGAWQFLNDFQGSGL